MTQNHILVRKFKNAEVLRAVICQQSTSSDNEALLDFVAKGYSDQIRYCDITGFDLCPSEIYLRKIITARLNFKCPETDNR
jgi:hypothetical protein